MKISGKEKGKGGERAGNYALVTVGEKSVRMSADQVGEYLAVSGR